MHRLGNRLACGGATPLSQIPSGFFVLTAAHEDCRSGSLVRWVQQCAEEPPMVVVAMHKGHPIEPLIRDSRAFCLNQLDSDEIFLRKKFESTHRNGEDPFISLTATAAPSGSPVLLRASSFIDCELMRHLDIESEYEVYIGLVRQARFLRGGTVDDVPLHARSGGRGGSHHVPARTAMKRPA